MGNKMIGKAVNQFIQIAGMWALVWGLISPMSGMSYITIYPKVWKAIIKRRDEPVEMEEKVSV